MTLTISSLQIGQKSLDAEADTAAILPSLCSNETFEVRSRASTDSCDVEGEELTESELTDGDNKLVLLAGKGFVVGNKDLPLPRILPPPRLRFDIFKPPKVGTKTSCAYLVNICEGT